MTELAPIPVNDSLANVMTGSGTTVDRKVHAQWQTRHYDQYQVEEAYRASWLMRKIVNLPPFDMTRAWRDWQAENKQIEALEAEERRLKVKDRIRSGLILGRLGGGIVIMGIRGAGGPNEPIATDRLQAGCLRYLHPLSRYQVKIGDFEDDPESDNFGEPRFFKIRGKSGAEAEIHHSRALIFKGLPGAGVASSGSGKTKEDTYWGDSVVAAVNDAVQNAVTAQDEFAGLIAEAKIDIYGIPELLNKMGNPVLEAQIMRRIELANIGKSIHRALIKDAAETWEQRQMQWGGMPEVIRTYMSIVAGAADIPATRLLGKSPDGMNSTGEGDERNYHEMIESQQESDLVPALDQLDEVIIPSALGSRPEEIHYDLTPLRVLSETQEAEIEAKFASTLTAIVNTSLIPEEALARATANRMVESGQWPGLEDALDDVGDKWWETIGAVEEDDELLLGGPDAPQVNPLPPPAQE